jgi:nickel-dependent lactate racemase
VIIDFPYPDINNMEIPDSCSVELLRLPEYRPQFTGPQLVRQALEKPIGTPKLRELASGKKRVLIVADDNTRPTPVSEFVSLILQELDEAGINKNQIRFVMSLGTHRPMSRKEIRQKLGPVVVDTYEVNNHNWEDPDSLEYLGDTAQGIPVWVNKLVRQSDLVIGLGAIMPIEICGFTGGGKILVPGLSGGQTVDEMHWTRIDVPPDQILGRAENPIRASIDSLARKAGLDFIVNVILNGEGDILAAVAGDLVKAHRAGCKIAMHVFGVRIPGEFDIVVADSHPFDIEFWQANKALGTSGEFVKKGGIIILVSPCYEGISRTHASQILKFGYQPIETIKKMVADGRLKHKVVGVHMYQVSTAAVEKGKLILVSQGISRQEANKLGFIWAKDPQEAIEIALQKVKEAPDIAVLKDASRMLPLNDISKVLSPAGIKKRFVCKTGRSVYGKAL